MDIATIIGLVLGVVMLVMGMGPENIVKMYIDMPSMYMVIGGGLASIFITLPMNVLITGLKAGKNLLTVAPVNVKELIENMVSYAEIARRDGILALEQVCEQVKDTNEFLAKGLSLAVDGTDPELIQQILQTEVESIGMRHDTGRKFYDAGGKYFPAWGMIGTLVGLVGMLYNMDDPANIGPMMAVAIITTYYGALMSNFFVLPFADKLEIRNEEEMFAKEIIIQGVMSIQSGDNPRIVEQKLNIYLAPGDRKQSDDG